MQVCRTRRNSKIQVLGLGLGLGLGLSHSTCLSHADEAYQAETAVDVHTFWVIRLRKPKDHRTAVSQRPSRFTPCYTIRCYLIKEV